MEMKKNGKYHFFFDYFHNLDLNQGNMKRNVLKFSYS
jgi:hypothetical protein